MKIKARPWKIKEWLIGRVLAKGYQYQFKGKSLWCVSDLDLATSVGIAMLRDNKSSAKKKIYAEYVKANDLACQEVRRTTKVYKQNPQAIDVASDSFLESYEWRRVRMVVLKRDGARCVCCGATPSDGLKMHVDHIKPRKLFPELALDLSNLQVLCEVCNHGKGNWDQTDWRAEPANDENIEHIRTIVREV